MFRSDIEAQIRQKVGGAATASKNLNAQIQQRASGLPGNVLSPSREMLPFLKGGGTPTILSNMTMGNRMIPARPPITSAMSVNRAGVIPPSTLAIGGRNGGTISSASAFGGINGGMGSATILPTASASPLSVGGISSSITSAGTGIMNTIGQYIPLAIKIILAVIVIKIVLWLVRGRKR